MDKEWDIVITSKKKWYELNIRELFRYKDLVLMFVKRSFTAQYKQTILGPLWFIINPLLTSFISTIVFGNIAGIESDGVPYFLFYLCGYTLWNYFSTCVLDTSNTFVNNSNVMGKVYFPRLSMPIASTIFAAINMLVVFAMTLISMLIYNVQGYNIHLSWYFVFVPFLMVQTEILGLGTGIIISSLTTKYRDLAILTSFGLQLWMYATPIVYPVSMVKGVLRTIIYFNPMTSIINNFKYAMLGIGEVDYLFSGVSIIETIIIFLIGVIIFNKVEKTFMDTV